MNPYVDPVTGVLRNKLGITDRHDLKVAEYEITGRRIIKLHLQPIDGNFDLAHLRAIHHQIFQDVYDWAGQIRTINFSKREPSQTGWATQFANVNDIPKIATALEAALKQTNHLRDVRPQDFPAEMASIYVVLNTMHPFPEGNGRSTQTMLDQLARQAGHELRFNRVSAAQWNQAAARSMKQFNVTEPAMTRPADLKPIVEVFQRVVSPIQRYQGIER